jgi:hypothetical protein
MPESVTDRPTKAHEYIFLLTKSAKYFWDKAAAAEESTNRGSGNKKRKLAGEEQNARLNTHMGSSVPTEASPTRNLRSVWTIATQPWRGAHFATFPQAIPEKCIKAGSRAAGKRCDCDELIQTPLGSGPIEDPTMETGRAGMNRPRRTDEGRRPITRREQRGHAKQMRESQYREEMEGICGPAFEHYIRTDKSGARPLPPDILGDFTKRGWITPVASCKHPVEQADTILDPFFGAGTVGLVAEKLGRKWVGIDLNLDYCLMAFDRITGWG